MARRSTKTPPPDDFEEKILDIDVVDEMQGSFLEYAYSVIYSRALPDARDGMKPVHRRIVYQMNEMGLRPDRGYVKCARVVGEVMGKLHPHGDASIYDALVRMAQPFSMRLPLVDGHGNFGSLGNDDPPAAMRYTECRMADATSLMTESIDEDTVDFSPNYDGQEREPVALPAAFPNLLVNGASGIAVGMATNMPPHNLGEVVAAARHLIKHPGADLETLMRFVPGPDLPTGGRIVGLAGHQGRLRDRPRHVQDPRDGDGGGRDGPPQGPRRHRTALHRRPGEGDREDQGPGRPEEAPGHRRRQGPHRPCARSAPGHRDQERLHPRGRAGAALQADADGGVLRHQQRGAGRRPAADAGPQGAAGGLSRPPLRGRAAAQRVPAREEARPAASGRGPARRAARHRRGHPPHPLQREFGAGQGAPHRALLAQRGPDAVHPGHPAAPAHQVRPDRAGERAGQADRRDRGADPDPGVRHGAAQARLRRTGRGGQEVRHRAAHGPAGVRGHPGTRRVPAGGGRPVPGAAVLHGAAGPYGHR